MLGLNMSRVFKAPKQTVFNAIADGVLFKYTGITKDSSFDFKVGGKLDLHWADCCPSTGEFTKINPYDEVEFTWNYHSDAADKQALTTVNIRLEEFEGITTLTLIHTGFESLKERDDHNWGWDDTFKDLKTEFFELLRKNDQERDLSFKMKKIINAPAKRIFDAFVSTDEIQKFFVNGQTGEFKVGETVQWHFNGYEKAFDVHVHQLVPGELIKFNWGYAHVCMSLLELESNKTEVSIQCTGWPDTPEGVKDSYEECHGWMEVLYSWKLYVEGR